MVRRLGWDEMASYHGDEEWGVCSSIGCGDPWAFSFLHALVGAGFLSWDIHKPQQLLVEKLILGTSQGEFS
jgi:hypothetical protein